MLRLATLALAAILAACSSAPAPSPTTQATDIPIDGDWTRFIRRDLAAARAGTANGLLEPCWLPDGYALVQLFYYPAEHDSTDQYYTDGQHPLHVWQAHRPPGQLGTDDPVRHGEPIDTATDIEWVADPWSRAQAGVDGFVVYSARLADGRTVSIDSTLPADVMKRVLETLCLRT